MSVIFAKMSQLCLNLSSLQQNFSLTSNYLGTNTFLGKRVDRRTKMAILEIDRKFHSSLNCYQLSMKMLPTGYYK